MAGAWFASLDESDPGYNWERVNEVAKFDAVQCSAAFTPTCVAGGEKVIGVSRSRGELWSWPIGPTTLFVESLSCTGPSECLILGKNETRWTNDLRNFPLRQSPTADPMGVENQTCIITGVFCVGIIEGAIYTTRDGAVTTWVKSDYQGGRPTSVGCIPGKTNPAVCVVTTADFLWIGTMSQGANRWTWVAADPDPAEKLKAAGCTASGQCTVVGTGGEVLTSDYAIHGLLKWTEHILPSDSAPIDARPDLDSVACPAHNFCLAGGKHGPDVIIASTTDNWTDFSYDQIPGVEGMMPTIKSFGCETVDRCVAVGGTALIGVRTLSRGSGCRCSRQRCSKSRVDGRPGRRCLRAHPR
jgi:hypothetical protein